MESRKIIEKYIGKSMELCVEYHYDDKPTPIDEMIQFLNSSKENGATHIKFDGYCYDGVCESVDIQPVLIEEESTKDYETRIKENRNIELAVKNEANAKRRALYEELKLEFE